MADGWDFFASLILILRNFGTFVLLFVSKIGVILAPRVLLGGSLAVLGGHGVTLGSSGSPLGGHGVAQTAKFVILLRLSVILKGPRGRPGGYGGHRPGTNSPISRGCGAQLSY